MPTVRGKVTRDEREKGVGMREEDRALKKVCKENTKGGSKKGECTEKKCLSGRDDRNSRDH